MDHESALVTAEVKLAIGSAKSVASFSGRWANQMGSTMDLSVAGTDVIGTYTSLNSSGGGPITGSLKGVTAGDLISFTVLWPGGSITAWVGQMVDEATAPRIKTLWHLVTEVEDAHEPTKLWMSVLAGADEFHR